MHLNQTVDFVTSEFLFDLEIKKLVSLIVYLSAILQGISEIIFLFTKEFNDP